MVAGHFNLSEEELEALYKEKEEKKRQYMKNWREQQKEEDRDTYYRKSAEQVNRSREKDPERHRQTVHNRKANYLETKRYHCAVCNKSFTSSTSLKSHLTRPVHFRKLKQHLNPNVCTICDLGFAKPSNLRRHYLSKQHQDAVKAKASEAVVEGALAEVEEQPANVPDEDLDADGVPEDQDQDEDKDKDKEEASMDVDNAPQDKEDASEDQEDISKDSELEPTDNEPSMVVPDKPKAEEKFLPAKGGASKVDKTGDQQSSASEFI
ncbi:hypothetical protein N656DRAFT_825472 [Canariomyces notabilis]|uniref:C2H2-type domain-containing protein n=1 Tax=Canariomyces notabilis TaxID=2074819 RepID=A0AAN6YX40_9PEZI|nr:hypothetical protein N656DRAFT_825472 [Canariomyces arenarius]